MKYKANKNWNGLQEFESNKSVFEKMAELGYLKKLDPEVKPRKTKVDPALKTRKNK